MLVRPPVFAEALARVLQRPDLDVIVLTEATDTTDTTDTTDGLRSSDGPDAPDFPDSREHGSGYDGVLVSRQGQHHDPAAPVVIRIPDPEDAGVGSVRTLEGERDVDLHSLEAVRGLVEDLWPPAGG